MKKRANRGISKKSLEAEERRLKRIKNQCGKWLLSMSSDLMKKEETEGQERVVTEMAADESWNGNTEKDWTREGKRGSKQKRTNAQELKFCLKKKLWEGIHVYGREIQLTRNRNKSIPSKLMNNIGQRKRNTKAWRKKVPEQRKEEKFRDWRGGEKIWEREEV